MGNVAVEVPLPSPSPLTPIYSAKSQLDCKEEQPIKSELNAFAEPYLSQSPISNESSIPIPYFYDNEHEKRLENEQPQNRRNEQKELEQALTYSDNTKSIESNLQNETTESLEIVYDGRSSNDKDSTITPISPPAYTHPKRKLTNKNVVKPKI